MRFVAVVLVLGAACGDDGGTLADGGDAAVDAADGGATIAPPALPMAPSLACADGFSEVSWDGVMACAPFDGAMPEPCPDGEAHLIGGAGCEPIGTACPTGDFPDDPPADAVFVRAGATDGDGTRAAPYGTIEQALRRGIGTTVVIAKGVYEEQIGLQSRTTLIGACAAETIVTTSVNSLEGTIEANGTGVVVRDLSIVDSNSSGVVINGGSEITLSGVAIHRVAGYGLVAFTDARATVDRVVIRDVQEYTGMGGRGLNVERGANVELSDVVIEDTHEVAIFVSGEGASVTASRTVIRGVTPPRLGTRVGWGAIVQAGGALDLSESYVAETYDFGLFGNMGADIALRDVTIVDSVGDEGSGGSAIGVNIDVDFVGERVFIRNATLNGVAAAASTTTMTLRDFVIADVGSGSTLNRGGVYCEDGAHCILERGVIARSADTGIFGEDDGTVLDVTDVHLFDQVGDELGGLLVARGVYVHYGATANLTRVLVERSLDTAVFIHQSAAVNAEDLTIRDVRPRAEDGRMGRGVQVQLGGSFTLSRGLIENTGEGAIVALSEGTVVDVSGLVARDSSAPACVTDGTCPGIPGMLIGSGREAEVQVRDFELSRGATCGVLVAESASLTLTSGVVRENPIGACIQVDGFDVATLMNEVRYVDNDANLQTTMLVVPGTVGGVDM